MEESYSSKNQILKILVSLFEVHAQLLLIKTPHVLFFHTPFTVKGILQLQKTKKKRDLWHEQVVYWWWDELVDTEIAYHQDLRQKNNV